MKNRNKIKRLSAVILAAVLAVQPISEVSGKNWDRLLSKATTASAASGNNGNFSKDEVVYSTLSADGAVTGIYVVNTFDVKEAGTLKDSGNYSSVVNLTNGNPINQNGNTLEFTAPSGKFYYQGNLKSKELPWKLQISYTLDGKSITPDLLAGKNGALQIDINTQQNPDVDAAFFNNYVLQISLTLDSGRCSNITAPDATIANAGSDKQLTFTVLPGTNGRLSVKADVTDFEMAGISIAAVPFQMNFDIPDTSGMTDDLNKLSAAIKQLNDGVGKLKEGAGQLAIGSGKLKEGSDRYQKGFSKLNSNSAAILNASSSIKEALKNISSSLKNQQGLNDISRLSLLPAALSQLSQGLKQLSGGLDTLHTGYSQAYSALDTAMAGLSSSTLTNEELAKISKNQDNEIVLKLLKSYQAAMTVKGTYDSVKAAFEAVNTGLVNMKASIDEISNGLDVISSQISKNLKEVDIAGQLTELSDGLGKLYTSYCSFDTGLSSYIGGVASLNNSYQGINSGIAAFYEGSGRLNSGTIQLSDGTGELYSQTKDMPEKLKSEINKLTADYDHSDFVPVSFTDSENNKVNMVQFVFKTSAVEKSEVSRSTAEKPKARSFIDKLFDLLR